jgi:hypothetical protein
MINESLSGRKAGEDSGRLHSEANGGRMAMQSVNIFCRLLSVLTLWQVIAKANE